MTHGPTSNLAVFILNQLVDVGNHPPPVAVAIPNRVMKPMIEATPAKIKAE